MPEPDWISQLHSDLQGCVNGNSIQHPFMWRVDVEANEISEINQTFASRLEESEMALAGKEWDCFFNVVERPCQFKMLEQHMAQMDDEQYARTFADIWVHSEEIWSNAEVIQRLLVARRPVRDLVMTEKEKSHFDNLPERIPLFRGFSHGNEAGLSWTLCEERAIWFARKDADQSHPPMLVRGSCAKGDVIAFFGRRSEQEILVLPQAVRIETTQRVG
jgi:hypothetical protein